MVGDLGGLGGLELDLPHSRFPFTLIQPNSPEAEYRALVRWRDRYSLILSSGKNE